MFFVLKRKNIYPTYVSRHNSNHEKQVIHLIIWNSERWHYISVKKLPSFLRRKASKNNDGLYCLNSLHSFRTENLNHIKKYVKIKDFCNIAISSEDTKILEFNQCKKSDKAPFIIYVDLECLIEKLMDVKLSLKIHLQQK